jgi:hypothetical protein
MRICAPSGWTTIPAAPNFFALYRGEICPLPTSSKPVHHLSTFVTVLIGEDA